MALIASNSTVPLNVKIVGGSGKGTFTPNATDRRSVEVDFGALKSPLYVGSHNLELGQGSFVITDDAVTSAATAASTAAADILEIGLITSDQTAASNVGVFFEGSIPAATGTGQRAFIAGSGKISFDIGDPHDGGKTFVVALDELAFPFLHNGAIEVLPGSYLAELDITDSTTATEINNRAVTYADIVGHEGAQGIDLSSGQGVITLNDTTDNELDVTVRLNQVAYPITLETSQTPVFKGSAVAFGYSAVTVS